MIDTREQIDLETKSHYSGFLAGPTLLARRLSCLSCCSDADFSSFRLAGMINSWGLLPDMEKEKAKKLCHECYDIFSRELTKVSTKESLEKSQQEWDRKYKELEAFRTRNASREDVFIDFLGCWYVLKLSRRCTTS